MTTAKIDKGNVETIIPLTSLQKGMFFRYLHGEQSYYVEQLSVTIQGNVEYDVFSQAWNCVLEKNQILKAVYRWEGLVEPVQIILKKFNLPIRIIDLSTQGAANDAALEQLLEKDRQQPFDITNGCIRLTLVKLGAAMHKLILSNMNILFDGWSIGLLCKDFLSFYHRIHSGRILKIDRSAQFSDYVEWLVKKDTRPSVAYWARYLDDWLDKTRLPYDQCGKDTQEVSTHTEPVDDALQQAIRDACRTHGITEAVLYYCAWGILLHRYNHQQDIVFGALISGKEVSFRSIENIVGLFTNCIPFRMRTAGVRNIRDLLQSVNRALIECVEHGDIDSSDIRRICRLVASNTLYDSVVVMENYPIPELEEDSSLIKLQDYSLWEKTNFPLVLRASDREGGGISFQYNTANFTAEDINLLAQCYKQIIQQIVSDPTQSLDNVELVPDSQKYKMLSHWDNTPMDYPSDQLLHKAFAERAKKYEDQAALCCGEDALTYGQLEKMSNQFAWYLRGLGINRGAHVAVYMERSFASIVALLGILKADCACVPLDVAFPAKRINAILEDSRVELLITSGDVSHLQGIFVQVSQYDENLFSALPGNPPDCNLTADDIAYIIYTSGSTGVPKGALLTHRGVMNHALMKRDILNIVSEDTVANNFSLNVVASIWQIWTPLLAGAKIVQYSNKLEIDIYALLKQAELDGVSVIELIPSQLATYLALLENGEEPLSLSSFKNIALTSEEIRANTVREFYRKYRIPLVNCYGQTECSDDVLHYVIPFDFDQEDVPIGKPSHNTRIYILSDPLKLQPVGFAGQIYVSGDGVCKGYWMNEELTKSKFLPNPYEDKSIMYGTGDIGFWTSDGLIRYRGRVDHQVKIRGNRIELREIERHMSEIPGIVHAAAAVGGEQGKDAVLTGFYTSETEIPVQTLRNLLLQNLPSYMIPSRFVHLSEMPLLPHGKIDRKSLSERSKMTGTDTLIQTSSASRDMEEEIAAIWSSVLKNDAFDRSGHFFDVGGNSLLILQVRSLLKNRFGIEIPIADLFRYTTIEALAEYVSGQSHNEDNADLQTKDVKREEVSNKSADIAIVGIACRFPGAESKEAYWENLLRGEETLCHFVEESPLNSKSGMKYVPVWGTLRDIDQFDPDFFRFTSREAEITDPQQRLFLECAWEALEDAGYDPNRYNGDIGVFAGVGPSYYLLNNILPNRALLEQLGEFQLSLGNDKDYLCTRVSHKLGLTGPSVTIQTACSSSLVSVHMAVSALRSHECDMALAGGVSIRLQQYQGYFYQEEGNMSASGRCRPFDANADGTVFGDGVGIVVLKRLEDALRDHDQIWCVIKGSAINNDGNRKVGFTAPSVNQQADVISKAYRDAGVPIDSIGYIEAHGTATRLGDPIEISALNKVFSNTSSDFRCPIGSVKANIGHIDVASGIAGLIKTAYMIRENRILPDIQFEEPNPEIDMGRFYVPSNQEQWQKTGIRRAGVSSFGIGGTNVHLVLEQSPCTHPNIEESQKYWVVPLSGRTETAVHEERKRLAAYLTVNEDVSLDNVAFTLFHGRSLFQYRSAIVASSVKEALELLEAEPSIMKTGKHRIIFLFSGQGVGTRRMGSWLYKTFAYFRECVDICLALVSEYFPFSASSFFIADDVDPGPSENDSAEIAQINIFVYQYAMTRLLMHWGIKPEVVIGHSLGEFVAACISGVYSLEETFYLLIERGRSFEHVSDGAMISVEMDETRAGSFCGNGIYLVAVNGPDMCVLSVGKKDTQALCDQLDVEGVSYKHLKISKAVHTPQLSEAADQFAACFGNIEPKTLSIPWISTVTGNYIKSNDIDSDYWRRHMCEPVLYYKSLLQLSRDEDKGANVFLEIAPGRSLTSLAGATEIQQSKGITTGIHEGTDAQCELALVRALAGIWQMGYSFSADELFSQSCRRISLPSYPFERKRCWIDPVTVENDHAEEKTARWDQWLYTSEWQQASALSMISGSNNEDWLTIIFADEIGIAEAVEQQLKCVESLLVYGGDVYRKISENRYILDYCNPQMYEQLLHDTSRATDRIRILYLSALGNEFPDTTLDETSFTNRQHKGLYGLLFLTQAILKSSHLKRIRMALVTDDAFDVLGNESFDSVNAPISAACRIITQENLWIQCKHIDLDGVLRNPNYKKTAIRICEEMQGGYEDTTIAYRGMKRWKPLYRNIPIDLGSEMNSPVRSGGVYVIAGGLGRIGLCFAAYLANRGASQLYLLSRRDFPDRESWDAYKKENDDDLTEKIGVLQSIISMGVDVRIRCTDIADIEALNKLKNEIHGLGCNVHGIIHAAGLTDEESTASVAETTVEYCRKQFASKVNGVLAMEEVFGEEPLDFFLMNSSLSVNLGGLGLFSYAAAHSFLNDYCILKNKEDRITHLCVNWDRWDFSKETPIESASGITREDGMQLIPHLMNRLKEQTVIVVSRTDVEKRAKRTRVKEEVPLKIIHSKESVSIEEKTDFLRSVWEELIGASSIGVHDDFFELGGHSLLAVQMIARIKERFRVNVPIRLIFDHPTIHEIVNYIENTDKADSV